jgi:hypothetical protein
VPSSDPSWSRLRLEASWYDDVVDDPSVSL